MGRFFGTDGIRGVANQYPMTSEFVEKVAQAAAFLFKEKGKNPRIIIGQDTRFSGDMLTSALVSGICKMGVDAGVTGVLPTPGIAWLTVFEKAFINRYWSSPESCRY